MILMVGVGANQKAGGSMASRGIGVSGLVLGGLLWGCAGGGASGPVLGPAPEPEERLERDVRWLVGAGPRNASDRAVLAGVGEEIGDRLRSMGYEIRMEPVAGPDGSETFNVIAEKRGSSLTGEIVVVGAHYDTEVGTPGADDNASGVAAMLDLASRFRDRGHARTLRFVAYTNEELSNSGGVETMGSAFRARAARDAGENIVAMLSLEMLGYYSDEPNSQNYPFPTDRGFAAALDLPREANFIAVVARWSEGELVQKLGSAMERVGSIRVLSAALPPVVREIYRSDHANYWRQGYQAAMVTDTSFARNPHYHQPTDTPETLDYARMADVVEALEEGIGALLNEEATRAGG